MKNELNQLKKSKSTFFEKRIFNSIIFLFLYFFAYNLTEVNAQVTLNDFTTGSYNGIVYRLFVPENYNPSLKYPLVLYLHGAGERGNNNTSQMNEWPLMFAQDSNQTRWPSFILAPQCPAADQWVNTPWGNGSYSTDAIPISTDLSTVNTIITQLQSTYSLDSNRFYITGMSMGGYGTWDYIVRYPNKFAAAIPICGAGDPSKASNIKNVPLRFYHSSDDGAVPVSGSRDMNTALTNAGATDAVYKEYNGLGHLSWFAAYVEPGLLPWMFSQTKEPDAQAPTIPSGITSLSKTTSSIVFSWTASSDNYAVTYYLIFRDGIKIDSVITTTYLATYLTPNTTYSFTVKARDAIGNASEASGAVSVTTLSVPDTQAPTEPTNLVASAITSSGFTISWTASTDINGVLSYEVFRGTTSCGTTTSTSMNITGLTIATTYSITVRAKDASGNESSSSILPVTTLAHAPKYEAEEAIISGGLLQTDHVGYSGTGFWAQVSALGNYIEFTVAAAAGSQDITLRYASGFGTRTLSLYVNGVKIGQESFVTTSSWDTWADHVDNVTLNAGTNTIRYSYDAGDNGAINIDYLSMADDIQAPTTPTGLIASGITSTGFILNWNASSDNAGVVSYEVFRDSISCGTSTSTTLNITGLAAASVYNITVIARDAAGNISDASNELIVTTISTSIESTEAKIKVFPNPVFDVLNILNIESGSLISIYDLNGILTIQIMAENNNLNIDVSNLSQGFYFIKVRSQKGVYVYKIVKE